MPRCAVCRLLRGNEGEAETSNEGKKNSPLRPYTLSFLCSRLSLSPSRFLPGVFYYIVVARARLPPSSVVTFRRYRLRYRVSVPVKSKTLERVIFRPHSKFADFSLLSFPPSLALLSLLWSFNGANRRPKRSIITSAKTLGSVNYFTSFLAHILSNISPPSSLSYTHIHTRIRLGREITTPSSRIPRTSRTSSRVFGNTE